MILKQDPAENLAALQAQLDRFVATYNDDRPHRALGRRTPQEIFDAKVKAHPTRDYQPRTTS